MQLQVTVPVNDANDADDADDDAGDAGDANNADDANDANDGKQKRIKGMYTVKSKGHCKYGRWNPNRIIRFNVLKQLVAEDRVRTQQAETMEKELLEFCMQKFGKKKGGGRGGDTQENNAAASG